MKKESPFRLTFLIFALIAWPWVLCAAGPLKVFILAGQSNMEGQAVADLVGKDYNDGKGTLVKLMEDPAKAAMFKHLKAADGKWRVREDVWVRYRREGGPLLAGPLTVGFSVYGDTHHFGPELQFGHVIGDRFANQVLLIKTAWGGKSLFKDFRPPSSGGEIGPYYTKMIAEVREALANLKVDFPRYGGGYELAGFVWYQGWNDACDPGNAVPEYEGNLINLIHDVRRELNVPKLPFVVGELTGPSVVAPSSFAGVRRAQAAAAARPEFAGNVAFAETHDFVRKPEDSPNPGHGHHEFGNAETYFLVGDALGKAMLSLLTPPPAARSKLNAPRAAQKPPAIPPDLTRDRPENRNFTYNLGPTGMRGWIFTKPADFIDSCNGRTTTLSRQILVTHVGVKSPAEGVMAVDDVILGVGGKLFTDDARKSMGAAITEAEKYEQRGVLKLTRWRKGKTEEVSLKLRVIGGYSATAPYACPKSKLIFEDACTALSKERLTPTWHGAVSGLALLATGDAKYLPKVKALAHEIVPQAMKLELRSGMVIWDWSYKNVFLCEYYQVTRDRGVLPAIKNFTTYLAQGQSLYGTFGHGISQRTEDGKLHGSVPPYGPVNSAGLIANMAIVMGKRCGIADPEVDAAIDRATKFFAYFVDKGAVPYGEHMPWACHENNGKNAMAAVMFAVTNNKPVETKYYAKMVTASFQNREYGHTGQGFSYLWGALGAAAGGWQSAAAFFHEAAWHFDLVRRCDGSFTYDGGEQYGAGKTDDDTYFGKSGYYDLSPDATYVLTYSLPFRRLWITGKDAGPQNLLSTSDVKEAVASGHFYEDRKTKTIAELLVAMGDWSPVVRGMASMELAARPEAQGMVSDLIAMAGGENAWKRQSACEALGAIKNPKALPVLVRSLTHPDRWLRVKAAEALKNMGAEAMPMIADMLKALVSTAEPSLPVRWEDPVQLTQGQLAAALFGGLLNRSIEGIDTTLLYAAIKAVAQNADGMARATLVNTLAEKLTLQDVTALGPDILKAVKVRCPADTMFGNEIRMAGLVALTKYRFKEGIDAGIVLAKTQGGHGSESRTGKIMKLIVGYGKAAQPAIPHLKELIEDLNEQVRNNDFPADFNKARVGDVEDAIKAIQASTTQPDLRSIGAFHP